MKVKSFLKTYFEENNDRKNMADLFPKQTSNKSDLLLLLRNSLNALTLTGGVVYLFLGKNVC